MKICRQIVLLLVVALLLTGCGIKDYKSSTLSIDKKGRVTTVLVEDFDDSVYDFDDMKSTISSTIDAYNQENDEQSVELESCKKDAKKKLVYVKLRYSSTEAYQAFNDRELFCGTVEEASQTYDITGSFLAEDGTKLDADVVVAKEKEQQMLVLNEPITVELAGSILYASENVEIKDATTAVIRTDEVQENENAKTFISENAFIIYENK